MKFTETWWCLQGSLGSIGPNLGPKLNMLWCFYPVNIQQWHQSSCQISSMDVLAEITMRKEFNGHESLEPPPLSPVCADFNPNVPLLIQCVCGLNIWTVVKLLPDDVVFCCSFGFRFSLRDTSSTSTAVFNFNIHFRAGGRSVMVSLLPTKTLTIDGDTRLGQSGVPAARIFRNSKGPS